MTQGQSTQELSTAARGDSASLFTDNTRQTYAQTVIELIEEGKSVVLVEADLMKSAGTFPVQQRFPDRVVEVGIAEQNAVGVAAGLADMGLIPFVDTFAVLISRRSLDQVWMVVAFSHANVKLMGLYSGLTTADNGATHQSLEDIAILRTIPNMVILEPADTAELAQMIRAAVEHVGPVYIRSVRGNMARVYDEPPPFAIGQAVTLAPGDDVTILASGIMVPLALEARQTLAAEGLSARVVNPRTIKPLDVETVLRCARETAGIVTVEDHGVIGGLGGAVAELLSEEMPTPIRRIGVRDRFGDSGSFAHLLEKFGMDVPSIAEAARQLVAKQVPVGGGNRA